MLDLYSLGIVNAVVLGDGDVALFQKLGEEFLFVTVRDATLKLEHCSDSVEQCFLL